MPSETLEAGALVDVAGNRVIAPRAVRATSELAKTVGLMGRAVMDEDEALWLPRCAAIHTWFVRFPIDVAFLDEAGRVVKLRSRVRPWTPYLGALGASHVVEMAAGTIDRTQLSVGDVVGIVAA